MGAIRDQLTDLKYNLSSDNTSSRGFYWFITITAILLLVLGIGLEVAAIMGLMSGVFRIIGFVLLPVVIVIIFVIVALLSR